MIPTMMAETLASFFISGGVIMKAHVARRVAITLDAFFGRKKKVSIPASHTPNGSWSFSYLQHLNKRHTQIQIGDISTDQTETEEQTNGKDGSSVRFAVHRHLVSGIENGGEFGQTLGHDRGEEHVPCRQEEWEFCFFFSISISKSTQCILSIPLPGRKKKKRKKRTYQTSPYAAPIY